MPPFDPSAALAAGATLVTPNNRLARTLIARHDAAMMRMRRRTWTAGRALPWSIWITTLWREALEADAAPPELRVLSTAESQFLWERIVCDDAGLRDSVIDPGGPAGLAAEAWDLVHAWGGGGESWRAWRDSAEAPPDSDPGAFAQWAERFQRELAQRSAIDLAQLPDHLRRWAGGVPAWRNRTVSFVGFLELSPQQQRLRGALQAAGMAITVEAPPDEPGTVLRAAGATPREEVRMALAWARREVEEAPDRFVGIAIEDLASRRDEVRALAEDVLCPGLQLPGHVDAARPYSLSIGAPLAEHPVAATALRLIALAHGPLPRADAAALARSPFWAGPWTERARCERAWIEEGRAFVSWSDLANSLARSAAAQLRAAADGLSPRAQSPGSWAAQWRALLSGCGWPASADEQAAGYEARQAWERLLDAFAQLGHVDPLLTAGQAPAILRDMARRTLFQPESPPAPIAIMGLADAAALSFDALWVAGLSAQRWPPSPQPNPLLPLAWQREHRVPRSSTDRELAHAELVTRRLASAAPRVVMSSPAAVEDYESAPSALIDGGWPTIDQPGAAEDSARRLARTRDLEAIRDERAPPFAAGAAPGGAGTIESQSTCPFQAVARRRLRVEPWPGGFEALSYAERGQLVHATMAAFWLDVRTHAALVSLDRPSLEARTANAASVARGTLRAGRWQLLPPVVAAAELARIAGIAIQWIEKYERPRPPFRVTGIEEKTQLTLSSLTFHLKLDRIDTLEDGSVAIIDYKTGAVDGPRSWFADRPRSPQLGVYALALRSQAPPANVGAVAYARLKAGKIDLLGVASNPAAWPSLDDAAELRQPQGWQAITAWWDRRLPELAAEFRDGVATVTPRDAPASCRACRLHPLCRIGEAGLDREPSEDA